MKDFRQGTGAAYYIEPPRRTNPADHFIGGSHPSRSAGTDPRTKGTNPRKKGTNPRRDGTNPSASEAADIARVGRLRRRAIARFRVSSHQAWCVTCDDTGLVEVGGGQREYVRCTDHRQMTANEAADVLEGHAV